MAKSEDLRTHGATVGFQQVEVFQNKQEDEPQQAAQPEEKYMQTGVSGKGEPVYSIEQPSNKFTPDNLWGATGFRDWARKTWAQVFDPEYASPLLSEAQREIVPQVQKNLETNLNKTLQWDSWIKGITGISSEEAAEGLAPLVSDSDPGDMVANIVGGSKRAIGQGFWTGLGMFGAFDYAQRKVSVLSKAVDEIADSVSVLPDVKEYGDFRDYFITVSPVTWIYQAARIVSGYGTPGAADMVQEKIMRNLNSSRVAYSLYADAAKRDEYIRRYEEGENPQLLAMEYENAWIELAGSIFLDPSTYMGIGYISKFGKAKNLANPAKFLGVKLPWEMKYLPTFGETIGLAIGKGRVANEATRALSYADPAMEKALAQLGNVSNDPQALQVIKRTVKTIKEGIEKERGNYSFAAYSSTGKANLFAKDSGLIMNTILSANPSQQELVDEILPALIKLARGKDDEILDAISTLKNTRVPMEVALSQRGIQTAEALAKLADDGIVQRIANREGDLFKMGDDILKSIEKVSHEIYPSLDEMEQAADALKAGKKLSEKGQKLAAYYDDVPDRIKTIRAITKKYEKIWKPIAGGMANVYIRLNPAFTPRNILGQGVGLLMDLGIGDAAAISARSGMAYSKTLSARLLQSNADEMMKIAGAVPARMSAGFGGTDIIKAGIASRSEGIASSEIFLRVTRDTIEKAMGQGAFPSVENLTRAGMLDEDAKLLLGIMKKNYGSSGKSWDEFKKIVADGQIETFRNIDPPTKVKKMLQDTHLWNDFENLRATAQSGDEFVEGMTKIKDRYTAAAERVINDPKALSSEIPEAVQGMAEEIGKLADEAQVSEEAADLFTRMVQGWRNARASSDSLYVRMTQSLHLAASQVLGMDGANQLAAKYSGEAERLFAEYDAVYSGVDKVRNQVRKLVKMLDEGNSPQDILRQSRVLKNSKETLWELTGTFSNPKELRKALWESYFEFGRTTWRSANEMFIDSKLGVLDNYANEAGVSLDEMAKSGDFSELLGRVANDRNIAGELDTLVSQTPLGPEFVVRLGSTQHGGEIAKIARQYGLSSVSDSGAKLDKKLLNIVNKGSEVKYNSMNDVPKDIAEKAFADHQYNVFNDVLTKGGTKEEIDVARKGMAAIDNKLRPVPEEVMKKGRVLAPFAEEGPMSMARVLYENQSGFFSDLDKYADNIIGSWGETQPISTKITPEIENAFNVFGKEADKRMALVKGKAMAYAEGMRDFLLHDYNKTYADLAVGYLSPFHYWSNRTYMRYLERAIDNPGHAAAYLKYRQFMEREHAGMPDWWKYNITLKGLPGMGDTPLMFNLEATINPLNGLTGTDFNDPYKRVDWLSSVVDDVQKFGPTLMTPINWAVALHLYSKGEQDAANRWMGRLLPQTQAIKAGLSLANIRLPETPFSRHNELDPFVNFLMGGIDPYEERRVGRAMGGMVLDGTVDAETAIDSSLYREGATYDTAVERAIDERAPGQLFSFFAGVGFKPRTEGDMQVDQFYGEYFQLTGMRENMSSLEYMNAMDSLRDKYPFMDTVLIGKRAGPDRESAYSYNVLSRIPPGMSKDITDKFGLDYDLVSRFYDDKGDMTGWKKSDKDKFLASMMDMGAMLKIPAGTTKGDWNIAKDQYGQMKDAIIEQFGEDIYDKIDHYYSLPNTGQARMFMDQNQEVQAAMDTQQGIIVNNRTLSKYYGGIDTLDRYYNGKVYDTLEKEFGSDIVTKEQVYFDLRKDETLGLAPKGTSKKYLKENKLGDYWDRKSELKDEAFGLVVRFGARLPDSPVPQLRPDLTPEQQSLIEPKPPVDWVKLLGAPTLELIQMSYLDGSDLPRVIQSELEYQSSRYGYDDPNDMLRDILIDLQR